MLDLFDREFNTICPRNLKGLRRRKEAVNRTFPNLVKKNTGCFWCFEKNMTRLMRPTGRFIDTLLLVGYQKDDSCNLFCYLRYSFHLWGELQTPNPSSNLPGRIPVGFRP